MLCGAVLLTAGARAAWADLSVGLQTMSEDPCSGWVPAETANQPGHHHWLGRLANGVYRRPGKPCRACRQNGSAGRGPGQMIQSLKFPTAWPNYALDWSQNSAKFCTLATASFTAASQNQVPRWPGPAPLMSQVQVISAGKRSDTGFSKASADTAFDYVATKLLWSPSKVLPRAVGGSGQPARLRGRNTWPSAGTASICGAGRRRAGSWSWSPSWFRYGLAAHGVPLMRPRRRT